MKQTSLTMSRPEAIPDQTSNAGPENQEMDWRDWLYEAEDAAKRAGRAEDKKKRLAAIHRAMDALKEAEARLCK